MVLLVGLLLLGSTGHRLLEDSSSEDTLGVGVRSLIPLPGSEALTARRGRNFQFSKWQYYPKQCQANSIKPKVSIEVPLV